MADKRDYYEVLGVKKDATADEIKKAYRKITKENHPDLHPGDKACEERFKEANEAYEVLSDEEKRKKYDQLAMLPLTPTPALAAAVSAASVILAASAALVTFSATCLAAASAVQAATPTPPARARTCAPA